MKTTDRTRPPATEYPEAFRKACLKKEADTAAQRDRQLLAGAAALESERLNNICLRCGHPKNGHATDWFDKGDAEVSRCLLTKGGEWPGDAREKTAELCECSGFVRVMKTQPMPAPDALKVLAQALKRKETPTMPLREAQSVVALARLDELQGRFSEAISVLMEHTVEDCYKELPRDEVDVNIRALKGEPDRTKVFYRQLDNYSNLFTETALRYFREAQKIGFTSSEAKHAVDGWIAGTINATCKMIRKMCYGPNANDDKPRPTWLKPRIKAEVAGEDVMLLEVRAMIANVNAVIDSAAVKPSITALKTLISSASEPAVPVTKSEQKALIYRHIHDVAVAHPEWREKGNAITFGHVCERLDRGGAPIPDFWNAKDWNDALAKHRTKTKQYIRAVIKGKKA